MPTDADKAYSRGLGQGFRMADEARKAAFDEAAKHFPEIGEFGNVTGCEECEWQPTKILQSRKQFIEHIKKLGERQSKAEDRG